MLAWYRRLKLRRTLRKQAEAAKQERIADLIVKTRLDTYRLDREDRHTGWRTNR